MKRLIQLLMNRLIGIGALAVASVFAHDCWAQCGSVGDPIVSITFGTSADPDIGAGSTTYTPNQYGQLTDGEYKLGSNVNQGRSEWHHLMDHTLGQEEGMMLIVNASYEAGEFYRIRVSGLCQDTRFRFSAWIANANRPENCGSFVTPNVRFVIEDLNGNAVSDPYATGNIGVVPTPQWREYGFEFDTGNQTEFDLVLINDNPGGCGNDLAIDDIQFRPCGPEIVLDMDLTLKQADTLFFCEGTTNPITIGSEIISNDAYAETPAFQWQTRQEEEATWQDMPGEDGEELRVMPMHNRWYRLTAAASKANLDNLLCRIASNSIRVAQLAPQPTTPSAISLGPLCENDSVVLDPPEYAAENAGPLTYQWQLDTGDGPVDLPDGGSPNYVFHAAVPGTFLLSRQAIDGCGGRFTTHTYEIEVPETVHATFDLPQHTSCADGEPIRLSGGDIIGGDPAMEGIYSGNGVSNGYFYPGIAGVGQHTLTFSPPEGVPCYVPSQATITVYDTVYLHPMVNAVILPGQRITLQPQTNASQFSWSGQPGLDAYHVQYPVASPDETTTYTLTASNVAGCVKVGEVTVTVLPKIELPNSFTPNGDGINDTWEIDGLADYPNARIQVFNRWGALVFSSLGYDTPWNGQFNGAALPVGTYYYTLSSDVLEQPLSGSVSILR